VQTAPVFRSLPGSQAPHEVMLVELPLQPVPPPHSPSTDRGIAL